jgi:hypothetical protein
MEDREFIELKEAVRKTVFSPKASSEAIESSSEMRAINNARMCNLRGIIEVTELKDMARHILQLLPSVPDKSKWEDLYSRLYKFIEELKKECRCAEYKLEENKKEKLKSVI